MGLFCCGSCHGGVLEKCRELGCLPRFPSGLQDGTMFNMFYFHFYCCLQSELEKSNIKKSKREVFTTSTTSSSFGTMIEC